MKIRRPPSFSYYRASIKAKYVLKNSTVAQLRDFFIKDGAPFDVATKLAHIYFDAFGTEKEQKE